MSTYDTLRDRALNFVGCFGQVEAQTVAQIVLEEAMKFVAFYVRIPSLIASSQFTIVASNPQTEANAPTLDAAGFNVLASYQAPDRLYVKSSASADGYGVPYEYLEYHYFIDLQSIPSGGRIGVSTPGTVDERPRYSWTITPSNKVWISPLTTGNVATLFYKKNPAAYSGAGTPEILPRYDYILVDACTAVLKDWLRDPEAVTTARDIFRAKIMPDIGLYDLENSAARKRSHLKIHKSYRPTRYGRNTL